MAGSERVMGDETEFQKAYQDHRDEKQEARRLQGELARLTQGRDEAEIQIEAEERIARAAHAETVATADAKLKADLDLTCAKMQRVAGDITQTEASLEAIRKRATKRTESLFSLLNDDLRQQ